MTKFYTSQKSSSSGLVMIDASTIEELKQQLLTSLVSGDRSRSTGKSMNNVYQYSFLAEIHCGLWGQKSP